MVTPYQMMTYSFILDIVNASVYLLLTIFSITYYLEYIFGITNIDCNSFRYSLSLS